LKIHRSDIPEGARDETEFPYDLLPPDIDFQHPEHPIRRVFMTAYHKHAVCWSFHWMMLHRQAFELRSVRNNDRLPDFGVARGVRLMALLRERGVKVSTRRVRNAALYCLLDLFGPLSFKRYRKAAYKNQLTLAELKELFDDAWGVPLLPPLHEMESAWEVLETATRTFAKSKERTTEKVAAVREEFLRLLNLDGGRTTKHRSRETYTALRGILSR